VAQYARHLRRFAFWLDAEHLPDEVSALAPEHVARFLASAEAQRQPDGRSKRTGSLNALRSALRGFFAYLERAGLVERSPARVLRMARVGATPPKGLSTNDVAALLAALAKATTVAGRRDRALFSFLLGTGARLGSALALEVADLDLAAGTATLRELKGGGSMTVYLRAELVALLTAAVGDRRLVPVFAGRDSGHLSPRHVQRRFGDWLAEAGVRGRYSPHSLRHTLAIGLYVKTRDVLLVKQAIGQQFISSTLVYTTLGGSGARGIRRLTRQRYRDAGAFKRTTALCKVQRDHRSQFSRAVASLTMRLERLSLHRGLPFLGLGGWPALVTGEPQSGHDAKARRRRERPDPADRWGLPAVQPYQSRSPRLYMRSSSFSEMDLGSLRGRARRTGAGTLLSCSSSAVQ
jgi:site-specific recombinase XerD